MARAAPTGRAGSCPSGSGGTWLREHAPFGRTFNIMPTAFGHTPSLTECAVRPAPRLPRRGLGLGGMAAELEDRLRDQWIPDTL